MSLPDAIEIRERIERVQDEKIRMFLKATYLLAARPRELTGKLDASAKTHNEIIYGPKGTDVFKAQTEPPDPHLKNVLGVIDEIKSEKISAEQAKADLSMKIPVAVFTIKIAKVELEPEEEPHFRLIALPMVKEFEPWTEQLYNYFKKKNNNYVFPFAREKVWDHISHNEKIFEGLLYTIQRYQRKVGEQRKTKNLPPRPRKVKLMALRFVREHELITKYDFSLDDLREFTGLILVLEALRLPVSPPKIVYGDWQRYIKKLCKVPKQ